MIVLTVDEVIALQEKLIAQTGGSQGLRDRGLLESALYSAHSAFGDQEQYPTVEEKAARLLYALVRNHAFVDGNKRIGVLIMLLTLHLNGIPFSCSQDALVQIALDVADGKADYAAVLAWIRSQQN